jgi:hypothetical protein
VYVRFGAAVLALAAGAAGVVVAVLLLRNVPGPAETATASASAPAPAQASSGRLVGGRIATPTEPAFPSPPGGAVVLAREAGSRALALAVKPGLVRVSVLKPLGGGAGGLDVTLRFGRGRSMPADPCGAGCYQVVLEGLPDSPVTVSLGGHAYRFDLPPVPAKAGGRMVARATATWNALRSLVWHERLGSSPTVVLHTVYRAVAPDRLSYRISGLSESVIIGHERWDRPTMNAPWERSVQDPPVRQPQPFWAGWTDAYLVGATPRAWRVSFFDPATPAWFEATIDRRTNRTVELSMITAAHFMHDVYGPFNADLRLVPPT